MNIKKDLSERYKIDHDLYLQRNSRDDFSFNHEYDVIPDYLSLFLEKAECIPLEVKVPLMRYYDSVLSESLMPTISDFYELHAFIASGEAMLSFTDSIAFKYSTIHGHTLLYVEGHISNFKIIANDLNINYIELNDVLID
ncbi:hypothetical protein [Pantoea agglomerans]|uniref:hypothetical protein n=1 Tax=Enterobacter agglomerans TaxID=549 RepID=UPI002F92B5BA